MRNLAAAAMFAVVMLGQRADVRNSRDHQLISRYPGSSIVEYNQRDFDQYPLALGVADNRPAKVQTLEGKVTKISYLNPPGRSPFEIYTNYADALKNAGFVVLWQCAGGGCGRNMHWSALNGLTTSGPAAEVRYLTVRKQGVTVAMAVSTSFSRLHIVEAKAMDGNQVTVSAAAMGEGIDRDGHMPVYAIYFDTGKATLKPESTPALAEIAKFLQQRQSLRLIVVGHTDNTGSMELNRKLSADRANSVMAALTGTYKIAPGRLRAEGVGPLAPVASNRTEEGKAKNRRVDLVEQ